MRFVGHAQQIAYYFLSTIFMKRQISTPLYLICLIFLLTISQLQAQRKEQSKTVTRKQMAQSRFEPTKNIVQKMIENASKRETKHNYVDFQSSKNTLNYAELKKASGSVSLSDLNSGKTGQDNTAKNWLKKTVFASKKRNSAVRQHLSSARKSAVTDVPVTLFVNYQAQGLGDGTSWDNAFLELADALFYANNNPGVSEIWVANGIYHPLFDHTYKDSGEGYNPRDNVFMLLPGIKLYGGFVGDETSVAERDLKISAGSEFTSVPGVDFATILSGDIFDNDYTGNTGENTYHVVFSAGVDGASLDGFVVAGGNANGDESVTVNEQTIPRTIGGGIAVFNSSPSLNNVLIADNYALSGSAIYGSGSDFVLTNALVIYNNASEYGTIYINKSSPVITNATITANTVNTNGGGIVFNGSSTEAAIRNTIVYGNEAPGDPNIFFINGAKASFAYSIIRGSGGSTAWNPGFGTDQGGNLDTNPLFSSFFYGYFGLTPKSPAINKGNNLYFQSGQLPDLSALTTDQRRTARITKGTVDIGALESLYGILTSDLMPNNEGILFVKKGGSGSKTGESWENAAAEVADALFAANIKSGVNEIWVGGGKYLPLYRPDDLSNDDPQNQYNTFLLADGTSLYGGFAGTEQSRDDRDLSLSQNASILSGDFNGNDDFNFADIQTNGIDEESENAYRVVSAVGLRQYGAGLDGFTIENGQNFAANFDDIMLVNETEVPAAFGSGILVLDANPLMENLVIRNNIGLLGGGLAGFNAGTVLTNSLIYHNIDVVAGSGIVHFSSYNPMVVFNTTVAQNFSLTNGPAVGIVGAAIFMANDIIYNNIMADDAPNGGGIPPRSDFNALGASGLIANSLIGQSGGSINWNLQISETETDLIDLGQNLDEDPKFKDITISDFSLTPCSPAIDAGDPDAYQENTLPEHDLVGSARIIHDKLDMGALEFTGNRAADATALAENGKSSSYTFEDLAPHTFSVDGETCAADLLTLVPEVLSGDVTARVWVDAQVNSYGEAFYLQRHFDITPADNAETATGRVVLYFTQAEFDALNTKLIVSAYLPTGNPDGEEDRKGNLRIYQFHGPSEGNTGSPSSYGSSRTAIDPDDSDINWNAGKNRWEVAFNVDGFSGFFGGTITQNPLPVRLVSFEGKLTSERETKLSWKVAEQEDIQTYNVEYSATGKNFNKIGQVAANKSANADYSFTDSLIRSGQQAYYRLKIIELDGKTAYSRIVSIKLSGLEGMIAYPVPAKNDLWIDWKKTDVNYVEVVDLSGKVLKTVNKLSASQKVDISGLPAGVFILKTKGNENFKIVKD